MNLDIDVAKPYIKKYLLGLSSLVIFIALLFVYMKSFHGEASDSGEIINKSGKQRMLSQRITLFASNYHENKDLEILFEYKTLLEKMLDDNAYIQEHTTNQKILDYYKVEPNLDSMVKDFVNLNNKFIKDPRKYNLDKIFEFQNQLLDKLNAAVLMHEFSLESRKSEFEKIILIVFLLVILVLVLEALFIYIPMLKNLSLSKKNLMNLNSSLEDKIKEANKELSNSFELIENLVITSKTDLDGNIIDVSKKFCQISKFSKEELIGNNHRIVKHPDNPKEIYDDIWETITQGKVWTGRIKNKTKHGEAYWVDSTIKPNYDAKGNHIGYFSYRVDVTDEVKNAELQKDNQKKLEQQVSEQIDLLRQQDIRMLEQSKLASMGEMMNNISHQWRQPLNSITLNGGSVKYGLTHDIYTKDEMIGYLDEINKSCSFLSKTIDTFSNFLSTSKEYKLCSIENEINTVKNIMGPSLDSNEIKLIDKTDYEKEHKCLMVENELSQVILNLLSNAQDILLEKKSNEEKWIKIETNTYNDKFVISVEDNAGGVPSNIKDKIFDPYFTTKFQSQGTGLGLAMSYDIVRKSIKGDLYFNNTSNGARFVIEIPLNKKA